MLSKAEYLEKHKTKFDKSGLSKADRSSRYRDYQLSKTMRAEGSRPSLPKGKKGVGALSYSTMSECSKLYMRALCDPWGVPGSPCVPDNITLPSYKVSFFSRGSLGIGATGAGFITCCPYNGMAGDAVYGNVTTESYSGSGYEPAVSGVANYVSNSSFASTQFTLGGGLRRRVVACGVRVRYVGPELTRGGRIIESRHPTNYNIVSGSTAAMLLANRETEPVPVNRSWHYVMWKPAVPEDLAYETSPSATLGFCLIALIIGAPVGTVFEYDTIAHYEIIGDAVPNLTVSHNDPLGMAVLTQGLAVHQPDSSPSENFQRVAKSVSSVARSTLSFVGPLLGVPPALTTLGESLIENILG